MQVTFAREELTEAKILVLGVRDEGALMEHTQQVDKALDGFISRAIQRMAFDGSWGKTLSLVPPGDQWDMLLLVGLGNSDEMNPANAINLGGRILVALNQARVKEASVALADNALPLLPEAVAAHLAAGLRLRDFRFDKYRTKEEDSAKPTVTKVTIMAPDPNKAADAFRDADKVIDGVLFTRTLVTEPANIIHPESLAEEAKSLTNLGVKIEVLGEKEMKKLGMNALLGVGQGSQFESKLVIMQWQGAEKKDAPVAFVGKGVTFDTGGISIKPSGGMEDMKWDMGGAGVVIGLMKALAGRKARVNAIGVVGLVENMPSHMAQRPGDVVTSMSGQTIEVINTDAEGRLVLADALWYTQDRFKPECMIDLATLTGAVIVALGSSRAGLMTNNDVLADRLMSAADEVEEPVWRLPLADVYDKQINSDIADMKNVGEGREAGTITAAQFLQRFVNDVPWAHLDIAGVAWSKKSSDVFDKGATGFGVRLLDRLVANHYEK